MTKPKVHWSKSLILFLVGSVLLIALDFITKWVVENNVSIGSPIEVIPNFFYINKSYNIAIAFSWGAAMGVWGRVLNITISVVMSVIIYFYWLTHHHKMSTFTRIIALLLAAGAVGNLIDRAFYWEGTTGFNGVIDFLQFYLGGGPSAPSGWLNPFATFNVADAYLTVGIVLLIVYLIVDAIKNRDRSLESDPRLAPNKIEKTDEEPKAEEKEPEA